MTIFRREVKVIMSKEEILQIKPKRGIDIVFTPIHTNSNIYVVTISGTDLNPSNPLEECEQNDLDEVIANNLKIYSDRIREPKELAKIPKIARQMAMNLDDKRLDSNKYDFLRSRAAALTATALTKEKDKDKEEDCLDCPPEEESGESNFKTFQEG